MVEQLSEVGLLKIYLIDFQEELILLIFIDISGPVWGLVFWPPDLKFCIQVSLIYILGYAFTFSQSLINCL